MDTRNVSKFFDELNAEQRSAALHNDGPLLVLAGAGTGKTRVITTRIANLLSRGMAAESILAVSFTRKAGKEMKARLSEMIGDRAEQTHVSTFHSLGLSILREYPAAAKLERGFKVCDAERQLELFECVHSHLEPNLFDGPAVEDIDAKALFRAINLAKTRGEEPNTLVQSSSMYDQLIGAAMDAYNSALLDNRLIDMDDMILLPVKALESDAELRAIYHDRFRYMMIDEYQDTNSPQHRLMMCLLGPEQNLCVVGDDDQSIYGFRGANRELILNFTREFPEARVVKLTANYRCSSEIIDVANAVIDGSPGRHEKSLVSANGPSAPVRFFEVADEEDERDFIVDDIRESKKREQRSFSDFTVLVRGQKDAREMKYAFQQSHVPCGSKEKGINVMTLHASKGLEFPVVYLPGVQEDKLPHWNAINSGTISVEEERRLFYVGVTRAEHRLTLSSARQRGSYACSRSRFADNLIDEALVEHHDLANETTVS
jgi:DNA helicase-2/ATP-dependent DNA helicase PcrA